MRFSRYFFLLFLLGFLACKTDKKQRKNNVVPEKSILEKIAAAHGYDHWNRVDEIRFTFNVDKDSTHFERSWAWKPKSNQVTSITGNDTLMYHRKQMDSVAHKINGGFINDRYWLLAPFNLLWDSNNFEHQHSLDGIAPISGQPMQKLTIVYGSDGGYTPGDAYDFYFGDDYLIREWVFRKGNQAEPSMTTTWENYQEVNGLKLAMDHKKEGEVFNLYFSGVTVK